MKGILCINLGTPDSPNPKDVKRYLLEFLTDGRVIDLPWAFRQLLVRGVIVPRRYRESSTNYQLIWTDNGSPLKVYTKSVAEKLQDYLGEGVFVDYAMRYQNPSIASALDRMLKQGVQEIIAVPLYPQYASATTGSTLDELYRVLRQYHTLPNMRVVSDFADHPSFINAISKTLENYDVESYDQVILSYHSLPERHLRKADKGCLQEGCCQRSKRYCYKAACYRTSKALANAYGLKGDQYTISFQSKLGKEPWIGPMTGELLREAPKRGWKKVLVLCPSFVADCIETIHEIGMEEKESFFNAGGEVFDLIPCVNDGCSWIKALADIALSR